MFVCLYVIFPCLLSIWNSYLFIHLSLHLLCSIFFVRLLAVDFQLHLAYVKTTAITALAKSSKNRHSAMLTSSISSSSSSLDIQPKAIDDQEKEQEQRGEPLWPKALNLLEQMGQDGIEPDGFCYSSAINCCGAEGRWKEACQLIEKMKRGGPRSRPNKIAYTAAISACGRAGQASKALELFQNMRDDGIPADRVAYNSLFSALRVSKDADKVGKRSRTLYTVSYCIWILY